MIDNPFLLLISTDGEHFKLVNLLQVVLVDFGDDGRLRLRMSNGDNYDFDYAVALQILNLLSGHAVFPDGAAARNTMKAIFERLATEK